MKAERWELWASNGKAQHKVGHFKTFGDAENVFKKVRKCLAEGVTLTLAQMQDGDVSLLVGDVDKETITIFLLIDKDKGIK
jgi:hypothetical protein